MKFGIRTPSPTRSLKARTTGKAKRYVKKSINPLYGKKGMGFINDPKKAAYNAVYRRTTISAKDAVDMVADGRSVPPKRRSRAWSLLKAVGIVALVLVVLAVIF